MVGQVVDIIFKLPKIVLSRTILTLSITDIVLSEQMEEAIEQFQFYPIIVFMQKDKAQVIILMQALKIRAVAKN